MADTESRKPQLPFERHAAICTRLSAVLDEEAISANAVVEILMSMFVHVLKQTSHPIANFEGTVKVMRTHLEAS